jgi:hypothetical protein
MYHASPSSSAHSIVQTKSLPEHQDRTSLNICGDGMLTANITIIFDTLKHLKFYSNTTFHIVDLFPSSGTTMKKIPTQLLPLDRASLVHWNVQ